MFDMFQKQREQNKDIILQERQVNVQERQANVNAGSIGESQVLEDLRERSDFLKWQQELEEDKEKLKHVLRNEVFDPDSEKWVRKKVGGEEQEPLCTEEGVQMIEAQVDPLLSRNMINTNFDDEFITNLLVGTEKTIIQSLGDNYDLYVVNSTPARLSEILRMVRNMIRPTPFRAKHGWTKVQDSSVVRRVETYADAPKPEKKWGLFN